MSIGGTLSEARRRAGLTVAGVSAHTRIRQPIIRAIEQDDFGACGGDFYARGHIRAIARTVGIDSEPLVREYDAARLPGPPAPAGQPVTMDDLLGPPAQARPAAAPVPPPGGRPASAGRPRPRHGPRTPPPGPGSERPRHERERPAGRTRERARGPWGLLAVLLTALAVLGLGSYRLAASGKQRLASSATSGQPAVRPRPPSVSPRPVPSGSSPSASPSPRPTHTAAPIRKVTPVSATAVGPGGASDGDNPQDASLALSADPSTPWNTDWYTTAKFGNLESGTGLLLDLGRKVTATGITFRLGSTPGADLQVRAGTSPGSLSTVASASDAGGTVSLRLASPVRARYVVIWFTLLPPDASGTYQASVSGVTVSAS